MTVTTQMVRTESELKQFIMFPWTIYARNPYWVPPLISAQRDKLDLRRNPFWRNATRELWLARKDGRTAGTIAAIIDNGRIRDLGEPVGAFGFFECVDDAEVARRLFETAAEWLSARGMKRMRGPYNPSGENEAGVLIEGFNTRPAVLEGHNPPYYPALLDCCGLRKYRDLFARLYRIRNGAADIPPRLAQVAERAAQRDDLRVRLLRLNDWDAEIELAWQIYTAALCDLPDYVSIALEDFRETAASFRQIMDPRLALIAEVNGRAVGYALAIPDVNEALQKVNGRLGPFEMLKLWWYSRRLTRVSYKILMMLPEFQGRGIEAVLTVALAKAIVAGGYCEVDMSMTGEENERSNRFQERLGFQVYRRYRLYEKEIA